MAERPCGAVPLLMGPMAAFVTRRARWILAVTIVFTVLAFALGGSVVSELKSGAALFQDSRSQSVRAFDELRRASGVDPDPSVVALVRSVLILTAAEHRPRRCRRDEHTGHQQQRDDAIK